MIRRIKYRDDVVATLHKINIDINLNVSKNMYK